MIRDTQYKWKNWLLGANIDYFIWIITTINRLIFDISALFKWIFCQIQKALQSRIWNPKRGYLSDNGYSIWMEELTAKCQIDYLIWILTTINRFIFMISALFKWIICQIQKAVQSAIWDPKKGHLYDDGYSIWMEELTARCQNRLFYLNPYYYKSIDF